MGQTAVLQRLLRVQASVFEARLIISSMPWHVGAYCAATAKKKFV